MKTVLLKTINDTTHSMRAVIERILINEGNLSKATKKEYIHRVGLFYRFSGIRNDNELIDCPTEELQDLLVSYTRHLLKRVNQGDLSANTIPKMFRGIKWLLNSNYREYDIHWKPIEALFSKSVKKSGYKAWTTDQIQSMIDSTRYLRNKAILHFQASTGGRIGVHDHPLLMKHLSPMDWNGHNCYAVLFYADEDETIEEKDTRLQQGDVQGGDSYYSFLTPEASKILDAYFTERKQIKGEVFNDNTPIFINTELRTSKPQKNRVDGTQLSDRSINAIIYRILNSMPEDMRIKKGRRYDIQLNHGFRKRTNTILKLESNINSNIAEKILGHKNGLDGVYLSPTREECFREFVKGIPQLTISDSERQKITILKLEKEKDRINALEDELNEIRNNPTIKRTVLELKKKMKILEAMLEE